MRRIAVTVAAALVLGACAEVTVETSQLSSGTLLPSVADSTTGALEDLAADICRRHAWTGLPASTAFDAEAADLKVAEDVVASAVRRRCPDTIYEPLSRAEVDWCGTGTNFGQNFFRVVAAGVDLGIESFTIVEPALIAKVATRSAELSDYEVELLTAELQTMSESSRFARDWAEACRATF
ncbi:MAG: hypothetical protein OEP52_10555 [Acidimicrobiia bacterium]|nr:hypothetical protein [Acidimicrobiia bacterium]